MRKFATEYLGTKRCLRCALCNSPDQPREKLMSAPTIVHTLRRNVFRIWRRLCTSRCAVREPAGPLKAKRAKISSNQTSIGKKLTTHVIPDSKEGWADALAFGMNTWAQGNDVEFDYSKLRPAGTRLKTMGGKASGPEPLRRLITFTREKMIARQGRRLRNIDIHDIICMIGDCVVSGGVRRSAMISLSDLDDNDIRDSKKGAFYTSEPQRMLANNSAVYIHKPSNTEFMDEWIALMKSGSGERGIFNRGSLATTLPERRIKVLKEHSGYFDPSGTNIIGPIGTNPCGEIILQSKQFCNLSEIVARAEDDEKSLLRKVRLATILGTYQASLTYFPYLSKEWKERCEEERLLGVSLTGQWDSRPHAIRIF